MPAVRTLPLVITAYLQQGIAIDSVFGTALDGLLASVVRDRRKAELSHAKGTLVTGSLLDGGLNEESPAVVDLPLARCPLSTGHDWHWLTTTAYPTNLDGTLASGDLDVHHEHCRPRERALEQIATRVPASVPPAYGRYRLRRLPVVTTPAYAVQWHAVGDSDRIADLLDDIPSIGRRRRTGEGTVLRWTVHPAPTTNDVTHGHCHPNGALGRPAPVTCVENLRLPSDRHGVSGIRPPYWHPATQRAVVLPEPLRGAR